MPKFVAQINANKIPILGLVPESNSTAPASPVKGQLWYDTTAGQGLKIYDGAAWSLAGAVSSVAGKTGAVTLVKGDVGLGNVDNTSDVNKPVSTAQQTALNGKVDTTRSVATGLGLLGGGTLAADKTLSVDFATSGTSSATQAVRADDSRLSNSRTPSGTAGGDLTGTYPNPTIGANKVTAAKIGADLVASGMAFQGITGSAGTTQQALRALGYVAGNALPGDATLDKIAPAAAPVDMQSHRIINVYDPANPQDAATKNYVDSVAQGLSAKNSVAVASTANIALATGGLLVVDGYQTVAGDRVLVKNQTAGAENGIYIASTGAWVRASDFDSPSDVVGAFVFVEQGTQGNSGYVQTTDGSVTIGTTALAFTQFSGAGQITSGAGMTKTGNTLDVVGTANRIKVNADNVDIDANYAGQTSINTVGTVTTGTWNATPVDAAHGGTGATDLVTARKNMGAPGFGYNANPALTAGVWTNLVHGVGTLTPLVSVSEVVGGELVYLDIKVVDANTISIKSDVAYGAGTLNIGVVGN